jgi:site-specific DNA recombinase
MEDIFKTKEGDREDQLMKLEKRIKELTEKLLKIDEMFVNGELEKDSHVRLKKSAQSEEVNLQSQHSQLKFADTNFMKYCKYGTSLLANLDFYYQEARPSVQKNYLVRYSLKNWFLKVEIIEPQDLTKLLNL